MGAGRAHTAARRTAGGRDKVRPQAGRTCEQSMPSSYPTSIVCLRAKHACRPKYAFGERIHAGKTCLHAILISCEHSLLAGEACLQTNVSMHSEREFMQARHASIPARGARGSGGG